MALIDYGMLYILYSLKPIKVFLKLCKRLLKHYCVCYTTIQAEIDFLADCGSPRLVEKKPRKFINQDLVSTQFSQYRMSDWLTNK